MDLALFLLLPISIAFFFVYKLLFKPILRRRFYSNQGVRFPQRYDWLFGDGQILRQQLESRMLKDGHYIYSSEVEKAHEEGNKDLEIVGLQLGKFTWLHIVTPHLVQEFIDRTPKDLDHAPITDITASKTLPNSFGFKTELDAYHRIRSVFVKAVSFDTLKFYEDRNFRNSLKRSILNQEQTFLNKEVDLYNILTQITQTIVTKTLTGLSLEEVFDDYEYIDEKGNYKTKRLNGFHFMMEHFDQIFIFGFKGVPCVIPEIMHTNLSAENRMIMRNSRKIRKIFGDLVENLRRARSEKNEQENPEETSVRRSFAECLIDADPDWGPYALMDQLMEFTAVELAGVSKQVCSLIYFLNKFKPEIMKKCIEEFTQVLFNGKEVNTVEDVEKHLDHSKLGDLPYFNDVLKENLRIDFAGFPQPYVAKRDFKFGGKYDIKKGDFLVANIQCLANNPNQWIKPREFLPERFNPESEYYKAPGGANRHPHSNVAFGAGRRGCIAASLIKIAVKYLFIYMAMSYDFDLSEDLKKRTDDISFGLMSNAKLMVTATRRSIS